MRLVRFTLIADTQSSTIDVNADQVVSIVDATPFQKGVKCTNIIMTSGSAFFVKESIDEVKDALLKGNV